MVPGMFQLDAGKCQMVAGDLILGLGLLWGDLNGFFHMLFVKHIRTARDYAYQYMSKSLPWADPGL